jgi:hypothetical protein
MCATYLALGLPGTDAAEAARMVRVLADAYGLADRSLLVGRRNVVLLFYPAAFTGICQGELCAIRDDLASFQNDDVQVLAVHPVRCSIMSLDLEEAMCATSVLWPPLCDVEDGFYGLGDCLGSPVLLYPPSRGRHQFEQLIPADTFGPGTV